MLNGYLYSQLSFSNLTPGDFHGKGGGGLKPLWRAPKYVVVLCCFNNVLRNYAFADILPINGLIIWKISRKTLLFTNDQSVSAFQPNSHSARNKDKEQIFTFKKLNPNTF